MYLSGSIILFIHLGLTIANVLMDFLGMIAETVLFAKTKSQISVKMAVHASKLLDVIYELFERLHNIYFSGKLVMLQSHVCARMDLKEVNVKYMISLKSSMVS